MKEPHLILAQLQPGSCTFVSHSCNFRNDRFLVGNRGELSDVLSRNNLTSDKDLVAVPREAAQWWSWDDFPLLTTVLR